MGNHNSQEESPDLVEEQFLKELSHGGQPHPLDEFASYYQEWKLENGSNKKLMKKRKVVLLTTGALCPVHRMHVQLFLAAKKMLEKQHEMVVIGGTKVDDVDTFAGFMSPSHDEYIISKLDSGHIPSEHRLAMCKLAISEAGPEAAWIFADPWECTRSSFIGFYRVTQTLDRAIQKKFPDDHIDVMYLCGADLIVRCGLAKLGKYSVVAVGRSGYSDAVHKFRDTHTDGGELYFCVEETEDVSSTKIRNRLAKGESIEDLTYPSVMEYIKTHKLGGFFKQTDTQSLNNATEHQ